MSGSDMRIRLVVCRQGVPDVKLVWPCSRAMTTAKLLEAIDEVIPLEGGTWGLEDYAVELVDDEGGRFECLHFQQLEGVLKDDDQVIVRSLLKDDVRRRRLSGRTQISSDGKRLIDGIAFGRNRYKAPRDRPLVELPPRKRLRYTAHEDDTYDPGAEGAENTERGLVLAADFDDADEDESDEDSDFEPEDAEDPEIEVGDLADELRLLEQDNGGSDSDSAASDTGDRASEAASDDLKQLAALKAAFPDVDSDELLSTYDQKQFSGPRTYASLAKRSTPSLTFDGMMALYDKLSEDPFEGQWEHDEVEGEEDPWSDASDFDDDSESDFMMKPHLQLAVLKASFPGLTRRVLKLKMNQKDQLGPETYASLAKMRKPALTFDDMMALYEEPPPVVLNQASDQEAEVESDDDQSSNEIVPDGSEKDILGGSNGQVTDESDETIALRAAFPLTPHSTIDDELARADKFLPRAYLSLAVKNDPALSFDEMMDRMVTGTPLSQAESEASFQGFGSAKSAKPLIQVVEEFDNSPRPKKTIQPADDDVTDTSSSGTSSEDEEAEEDSEDDSSDEDVESNSSESDSDDSDDDEDTGAGGSTADKKRKRDDSSDSDDESSSSSDEIPPVSHMARHGAGTKARQKASGKGRTEAKMVGAPSTVSKAKYKANRLASGKVQEDTNVDDSPESTDSSSDDTSSSEESDSESESDPDRSAVVAEPAQSKKDSGKSIRSLFKETEASSDLSSDDELENSIFTSWKTRKQPTPPAAVPAPTVTPGQGLTKTQKRNARRRQLKLRAREEKEAASVEDAQDTLMADDDALATRKAALLEVAKTFGDEIMGNTSPTTEDQPAVPEELESPSEQGIAEFPPSQEPEPQQVLVQEQPAEKATDSPRQRIDVGAGRRMLFGALGLRNPKTKEDEAKISEKLMKDVKVLQNHRLEPVSQPAAKQTTVDVDDWRKKIVYRAVECCHEGMELSEPPFPFLQRWDPEQSTKLMRKRKREAEVAEYYQDDTYADQDDEVIELPNPKRQMTGREHIQDDVVLDYDDPAPESAEDLEDLPPIPADTSVLVTLTHENATPGTVITWKQMIFSKKTQWQPQVVSLTGIVLESTKDGNLPVLLAKRDRDQDEREFDAQTGKRIYDKFEAPDDDTQTETFEDSGHRDLAWYEMMDAKILQGPPVGPEASSHDESATLAKSQSDGSIPSGQGKSEVSDGVQPNVSSASLESVTLDKSQSVPVGDVSAEDTLPDIPGEKNEAMAEDGGQSAEAGQSPAPELPTNRRDPVDRLSPASKSKTRDGTRSPEALEKSDELFSPSQQLQDMSQAAINRDMELPRSDDLVDDPMNDFEDVQEPASELIFSEADLPCVEDADETVGPTEGEDHNQELVDDDDDEVVLGEIEDDNLAGDDPEDNNNELIVPDTNIDPDDEPMVARFSVSNSPQSGRQPDDLFNESFVPETLPRASAGETVGPTEAINGSSSPMPSFEEVVSTARSSQAPHQASQVPIKPGTPLQAKRDAEYEEAMRRLDDGSDSDSDIKGRVKRNLFPNATQPARLDPLPKPKPKVTTPRSKRTASCAVPAGSEVITLSSSPVSETPVENYVDDSADETFNIVKGKPKRSGGKRKGRLGSVPAQTTRV